MENIIDQIDAYLDGTLSAEEKISFENQLAKDESLRQQLDVQRNLRAGIDRLGMKAATASTFRKMTLKNKIYKWGIATVAVVAVATAVYYGAQASSTSEEGSDITYELPSTNEEGNTNWAQADRNLPTQLFEINPAKDTVIETMNGIVFAIPAGAFLNAEDPFTLEIREALTPMDIMKGGLSTTSNGELLETGGMFYLNARNGETSLKINPEKPVYANVPTNEIRPGMMLFDGERKDDGSINWVNPKQMEKQLIPVDIFSLNFYPQGFLEKVAELGFDANDRKVTDSIYYSYAGRKPEQHTPDLFYEETYDPLTGKYQFVEIATGLESTEAWTYEIDPARIAAIKNEKFQNTILATKEFEMRMQAIFAHCKPEILDMYVSNLDKKLYQIDSMVAAMEWSGPDWGDAAINSDFRYLSSLRHGGVAISRTEMTKLQQYYQKKQEAVRMASEKMFAERTADQRRQDSIYFKSQSDQQTTTAVQKGENLRREFQINLKEAYRQLGINPKAPMSSGGGGGSSYGVTIETTGWKNIDQIVFEATINRTTLDYTDSLTGKRAVIRYEQLQIDVKDAAIYSQLMVYLVTDSLPCFMKVNPVDGVYSEKLNELLEYSLVIIAEKDGTWHYATTPKVTPGNVSVTLQSTDEATLRSILNTTYNGKVGTDFDAEVNYLRETHQFNVRKEKERQQEKIDREIMMVIFPCAHDVAPPVYSGSPK